MKAYLPVISVLACALLSACGGGGGGTSSLPVAAPAPQTPAIRPVITAVAPTLTVLDRTQFSGMTRPATVVVTDEARWAELLAQHARTASDALDLPKIDFTKQMVVGVFLGERMNGCGTVHVVSAEQAGQKMVITYAERDPRVPGGPEVLCTTALTYPAELVAIERTALPVEFARIDAAQGVAITDLERNIRSAVTAPKTAVVGNQADFDALWREHGGDKQPQIDFARQTVLAVFSGTTAEPCADIRIERVYQSAGRMVVEYRKAPQQTLLPCTKDIRSPAHIVAVPRAEMPYSFHLLPVADARVPAAGDKAELPVTELETSDSSAITEKTETVIADGEKWEAFWARHTANASVKPALPKIDFTRDMAIAIVQGGSNGGLGCASLTVDAVRFEGGKLVVEYHERANPTFAVCTASAVSRSVIVTVPRTDAAVEFRAGAKQ